MPYPVVGATTTGFRHRRASDPMFTVTPACIVNTPPGTGCTFPSKLLRNRTSRPYCTINFGENTVL